MAFVGQHEVVCSGVFLIGGEDLSGGGDCQVYAVDLGDLALIDSGCGPGWERIRENLRSTGLDPEALHTLVLTHAHIDHIGGAAAVASETKCRVVAHALDAPAIESGDPALTAANWYGVELAPIKVNHPVDGHEAMLSFSKGKLRLLHTPGHTPGSMVAVLESAGERVLFGQDIHGPFHPAFGSDIAAWRKSMQELLELKADILCEGHFGVMKPANSVRRFIEDQLAAHR